MKHTEVAIAGAGIIGLSVALELASAAVAGTETGMCFHKKICGISAAPATLLQAGIENDEDLCGFWDLIRQDLCARSALGLLSGPRQLQVSAPTIRPDWRRLRPAA